MRNFQIPGSGVHAFVLGDNDFGCMAECGFAGRTAILALLHSCVNRGTNMGPGDLIACIPGHLLELRIGWPIVAYGDETSSSSRRNLELDHRAVLDAMMFVRRVDPFQKHGLVPEEYAIAMFSHLGAARVCWFQRELHYRRADGTWARWLNEEVSLTEMEQQIGPAASEHAMELCFGRTFVRR